MQLSKKNTKKIQIIIGFLKFTSNFEHFEKMISLRA